MRPWTSNSRTSACICKLGGRPPPHEHCAIGGVGCARPADEICEPGRLRVATRPNWTGSALNLVSLGGRMPQAPEVFKRLRRRSATSPDKKTAVCPFVGVPSVVVGGSILPEPIEASSDGSWRWEPFEPGSPASCRPAGLSRNASAELLDFGLEH